jgi:uncharacterized protein YbgA (DUF1722 family)/uncharacterized protein YbbK (DUF523 family)
MIEFDFTPVRPEREAEGEAQEGPDLRLGISACLLGHEVRFDKGHKRDRFLLQTLGRYVTWYPVCPEVEVGMGTPRETLRLVGDKEAPRLVTRRSGVDHTDSMRRWSREKLDEIESWDLHGFVLKRGSPSCGLFRIKVYNDKGMPHPEGRGIFAAELVRRFPLFPVEEEGRLHDPPLRENFVERIFAYERWKRMLREEPTPGGLVKFHTGQKMTMLSHSPEHYRELGRLVAEAGSLPWAELTDRYSRMLAEGLRILATPGRHANVMHHLLGFLKEKLSPGDKTELLAQIDDYRRGLVPLVVPLTLLKHHLRRNELSSWVDEQVYLNPYPRELMLRNHV